MYVLCVAFEPVFVDEKTLNKIVQGAPSRSKGSQHLFRDMWNDGWSYLVSVTVVLGFTNIFCLNLQLFLRMLIIYFC